MGPQNEQIQYKIRVHRRSFSGDWRDGINVCSYNQQHSPRSGRNYIHVSVSFWFNFKWCTNRRSELFSSHLYWVPSITWKLLWGCRDVYDLSSCGDQPTIGNTYIYIWWFSKAQCCSSSSSSRRLRLIPCCLLVCFGPAAPLDTNIWKKHSWNYNILQICIQYLSIYPSIHPSSLKNNIRYISYSQQYRKHTLTFPDNLGLSDVATNRPAVSDLRLTPLESSSPQMIQAVDEVWSLQLTERSMIWDSTIHTPTKSIYSV